MAFDANGGGPKTSGMIGEARDCKPDYEKQAAEIKKRLDSRSELQESIFNFSDICGTYDFRNITSFAELIGGLNLQQHSESLHYNELLSKVEKN